MNNSHDETRNCGGPGRPATEDARNVRGLLLDTATRAFAVRGFHGTSLRSIADAVGVNSAMIHYYFGNKPGLYTQVLSDALEPLLARQQALTGDAAGPDLVAELFRMYADVARERPWLPRLIVRDILAADGEARSIFVERIAPRLRATLPPRIAQSIRGGRLREDLDPQLTTLSLVSLAVFPIVAMPILEAVLGVTADAEFYQRLAEHNTQLFEEGAGGG